MKLFKLTALFSVILIIYACKSDSKNQDLTEENGIEAEIPDSAHITSFEDVKKMKLSDTVFYFPNKKDSVRIKIIVPVKHEITGYILLLHGWNLPADELCENTSLCLNALDSGYALIIPDFGKTTYQWQNYPQTRKEYRKFPTRRWMNDTLIPYLQNEFDLLKNGDRNFVYGVSTGGRGAALLALENPEIFKAAACLSADFDHAKLKDEPINNGFYGAIKSFPERWTGKDNIYNRTSEFACGLYLAHGEKDKVCPVSQTVDFSKEFARLHPDLSMIAEIDPSGDHTYAYWNGKTIAILQFFSRF